MAEWEKYATGEADGEATEQPAKNPLADDVNPFIPQPERDERLDGKAALLDTMSRVDRMEAADTARLRVWSSKYGRGGINIDESPFVTPEAMVTPTVARKAYWGDKAWSGPRYTVGTETGVIGSLDTPTQMASRAALSQSASTAAMDAASGGADFSQAVPYFNIGTGYDNPLGSKAQSDLYGILGSWGLERDSKARAEALKERRTDIEGSVNEWQAYRDKVMATANSLAAEGPRPDQDEERDRIEHNQFYWGEVARAERNIKKANEELAAVKNAELGGKGLDKTAMRAAVDAAINGGVQAFASAPLRWAGLAYGYAVHGPHRTGKPDLDNTLTRAGDQIMKAANEAFPNDPVRQFDFANKLGQGAGSMAAMLGQAGIGGLLRAGAAGQTALIAISGAMQQGVQGYDEATQAFAKVMAEQKREDGLTDIETKKAWSFFWNSLAGTSDAAPFVKNWAKNAKTRHGYILGHAGEQALEEFLQEGGQQVSQNVIAGRLYDTTRPWNEDVGENMAIGGLLGGTVGGFGSAKHVVEIPAVYDGLRRQRDKAADDNDAARVAEIDSAIARFEHEYGFLNGRPVRVAKAKTGGASTTTDVTPVPSTEPKIEPPAPTPVPSAVPSPEPQVSPKHGLPPEIADHIARTNPDLARKYGIAVPLDTVPEAAPVERQTFTLGADDIAREAPARPAPSEGDLLAEMAPPAEPAQPITRRVVTPDNAMEVETQEQIVELAALKRATGDMQPRDRSRDESQVQARDIAANLDPEQMRAARVSDTGAPIVSSDDTIISGNGRTMALEQVYRDPALAERAAAYRASLGAAAAGMTEPVRILRLPKAMPVEALRAFADKSNRPRIAMMSATERAMRDAKAASDDVMGLYQGGDVTAPHNQQFFRAFLNKATNTAERGALSKDGRLTKEGSDRISNAILAAAYGDPELLSRMLESTDDNIRSVTGAMRDAAGAFIRMKQVMAAGEASPAFDITPQVVETARRIADLRDRGIKPADFLAQQDAFTAVDPVVEDLLRAFYNDNLSRMISRQKLTEVLVRYADEAAKHREDGLFEDTTRPADIIAIARDRTLAADADLFGQEAVEPGGAVAPDGDTVGRRGTDWGSDAAVGGGATGAIAQADDPVAKAVAGLTAALDGGLSLKRGDEAKLATALGVDRAMLPQVLERASERGIVSKDAATGRFTRPVTAPRSFGPGQEAEARQAIDGVIADALESVRPMMAPGQVVVPYDLLSAMPKDVQQHAIGETYIDAQFNLGTMTVDVSRAAFQVMARMKNGLGLMRGRLAHEGGHGLIHIGRIAARLNAIMKAQRENRPVPSRSELEEIGERDNIVMPANDLFLLAERARKLAKEKGAAGEPALFWPEEQYHALYSPHVRTHQATSGRQGWSPFMYARRIDEEAAMHLIDAYVADGQRFGRKIDTAIQRFLNILRRIGNALRGLGFRTADDVLRAFTAGEHANNAVEAQNIIRASVSPHEMTLPVEWFAEEISESPDQAPDGGILAAISRALPPRQSAKGAMFAFSENDEVNFGEAVAAAAAGRRVRVHGALSSYLLPSAEDRAAAENALKALPPYSMQAEFKRRIARAPTLSEVKAPEGHRLFRLDNPMMGSRDYVLTQGDGATRIASAVLNGDEIGYVSVAPSFQRQGYVGRLYDAIEADSGKMLYPSGEYLDPAMERFWARRMAKRNGETLFAFAGDPARARANTLEQRLWAAGLEPDEIARRIEIETGIKTTGADVIARNRFHSGRQSWEQKLHAAGLLTFAGEKALTADLNALARAKALAKDGASRERIWDETGWFRGVDGKWRWEIDDSKTAIGRLGPTWKAFDDYWYGASASGKLGDILRDHSGLRSAYPGIDAEHTIITMGGNSGQRGYGRISADAEDSTALRSILLHEKQHGIQEAEIFARGGSSRMFTSEELAAERARLMAQDTMAEGGWGSVGTFSGDAPDLDVGRTLYRRLAGEVEARNVQHRMNMTPEERRANPPWTTEDVPQDQQIVRFGSGPQMMASLETASERGEKAVPSDRDGRIDAGKAIDDGRPVFVDERIVVAHLAAARSHLSVVPEGIRVAAVTSVVPMLNPTKESDVIVTLRDVEGWSYAIESSASLIVGGRAIFDPRSGSIVLSRFGTTRDIDKSLRGEIYHEAGHALWWRDGFSGARVALLAHANSIGTLDADMGDYLRVLGSIPLDDMSINGITIRETYEYLYRDSDEASRRDLMDQESVAYLIEMDANGVLPAELTEAVRPILDAFAAGAYTGRSEAASEREAAQMAAVDASIGRSMRDDLDKLGYYSGALRAARNLRQAKGAPEQMRAMLRKEGASEAELQATGLDKFLSGKSSVTRDGIISHLEGHRVGLNEARYQDVDKIRPTQQAAAPFLPEWQANIARMETLRDEIGLVRKGAEQEYALLEARQDALHNEMVRATSGDVSGGPRWSPYSLDPSNPTHLETVLHLPTFGDAAIRERMAQMRREGVGSGGPHTWTDFEAVQNQLGKSGDWSNFMSGHFPEPNITGHLMTSMVKHEGKPVYLIDQIQDDWAQRIRDDSRNALAQKLYGKSFDDLDAAGRKAVSKEMSAMAERGERPAGVRDEAKIDGLRQKLQEAESATIAAEAERLPTLSQINMDGGSRGANIISQEVFGRGWIDLTSEERDRVAHVSAANAEKNRAVDRAINQARSNEDRIEAELNTALNAAPGHPLVNTTDQWVNTTLRRAIRQAVEADADYIAIPHGDTVLSYNPGDEGGMRGFYGSRTSEGIVPKNMRKLLQKIDRESPSPQKITEIETPDGKRAFNPEQRGSDFDREQTGFTLFPLTDKVKQSVMWEGQAMFAVSRGLDMSPEARTERLDQWRFPEGQTDAGRTYSAMRWHHGANRADRIAEKKGFDPRRASSGPMPFFTNDTEIASNYAKNKPDLSRYDEGNVADYFTVSPRDLGWKGARSPVRVEQSWSFLTPEQRQTIRERAKRVGHEDYENATGPYVLHPEGVEATLSGSHYDWLLSHEARGNPLTALRMMWHDGGELVGHEEEMADIWRLAGYPHPISDKTAPWYEAPGVVASYIRMSNPLITSDVDALLTTVVPALEKALKSDRTRRKKIGADMWDKNTRWTPKEWVAELEQNLSENKENGAYVWTSIPDKVTDVLRNLGYDAIVDTGGKGGGDRHLVAIPFSPQQVRSISAAFDPAESGSSNLLAAISDPMRGINAIIRDMAVDLGLTVKQGITTKAAKAAKAKVRKDAKDAARRAGATNAEANKAADEAVAKWAGYYNPRTGVFRTPIFYNTMQSVNMLADLGGMEIEKRLGADLADIIQRAAPGLPNGFQGWFRLFLTNGTAALAQAPKFTNKEGKPDDLYNAFFDLLQDKDEILLAKLLSTRDAIETYYKANPTDVAESMVVDSGKPTSWDQFQKDRDRFGLRAALMARLSTVYTATVDDLNPVYLGVRELLRTYLANTGKKLDLASALNPYKIMRVEARHANAYASRDMEEGIRPYDGVDPRGPSLVKALTLALGVDRSAALETGAGSRYRKFSTYLVSRYAMVEWGRFRDGTKERAPTAMPPGASNANEAIAFFNSVARTYEQQHPEFSQAADMVYDFQRELLTLQRDAGLITPEKFDDLVQDREYVPFLRSFEEEGEDLGSGRVLSGGQRSIFKTKRGSSRDIIDAIASIGQKVFETRQMIAQNDAKRSLMQLAEAAGPGGGILVERLDATRLKAMGIDVVAALRQAARENDVAEQDTADFVHMAQQLLGADATATIFSRQTLTPGNNVLFFWEQGRLQAMQLGGDGQMGARLAQAMYDTINTFGQQQHKVLMGMALLTAPAQMVRMGVTTHPEFAIANIIRDAWMAFVYDHRAVPLWTQAKGLIDVARKADYVKGYMRFGSMMGGEATSYADKLRHQRDTRALVERGYKFKDHPSLVNAVSHFAELFHARNWMDRASGAAVGAVAGGSMAGPAGLVAGGIIGGLAGGHLIAKVGEASETATRARVWKHGYDRAIKNGMGPVEAAQEAAFWAHDYTDYARHGSRTETWRSIVPFFNANVQGNDTYMRRLLGKGDYGYNTGLAYPLYRLGLKDITKLSARERQELGMSAWTWFMTVFGIGSVSMILALLYRDDERVKNAPEQMKSNHWLIPIDGDNIRETVFLRIPKPFQTVWFAQAIERMVMEQSKDNPRWVENYLFDLWNTWKPPLMPTTPGIAFDMATGVDSGTGRAIVPKWKEARLRRDMYDEYTSEFSKWLSRNVAGAPAPFYTDYMIRKLGASWANTALRLNSPGLLWYNPTKPEVGPDEMFIARRFLWTVGKGSEASRVLREMAGGEEPVTGIWQRLSIPYSKLTASAADYKLHIDRVVPDVTGAVDSMLQMTPRERGYAILGGMKGHEDAKLRMLDPVNRAAKIGQEIVKMQKEIIDDQQHSGKIGKQIGIDKPKPLPLSPSEKLAARQILTQLNMMEAHNALVLTGEAGWEKRIMFDTSDLKAEFKTALPKLYKEYEQRMTKAGVLPWRGMQAAWPAVKSAIEDDKAMDAVRKQRFEGLRARLIGRHAQAAAMRDKLPSPYTPAGYGEAAPEASVPSSSGGQTALEPVE